MLNFIKSLLPSSANQFIGFYMIGILDMHECSLLGMSENYFLESQITLIVFFHDIIVLCETFSWVLFPRCRYCYIEV